MITRGSGVVGHVTVTGIVSNMQIGNGDNVKVLCRKLRDHPWKIRKPILIHRERTILLLIIDIQIDSIGGDMVRAQMVRNFENSRLRRIAVTGLLKPKT